MSPTSHTSNDRSDVRPARLDHAKQLAATLLSERGEASGALVARQLHEVLRALDASDRHGFQRYLAAEFQPDKAALRAAAETRISKRRWPAGSSPSRAICATRATPALTWCPS